MSATAPAAEVSTPLLARHPHLLDDLTLWNQWAIELGERELMYRRGAAPADIERQSSIIHTLARFIQHDHEGCHG